MEQVTVLVAEGNFGSSAAQREAVAKLLEVYFGHQVELTHTESGAPRVSGFDGSVSISHCAVAVAVAVSREGAVGIDIESHRYDKMLRVAPRFVSPDRIAIDLGSPTMLAGTWCAKEAIYKYFEGKGLASHVAAVFPGQKLTLTIKHTKNYTLAVVTER